HRGQARRGRERATSNQLAYLLCHLSVERHVALTIQRQLHLGHPRSQGSTHAICCKLYRYNLPLYRRLYLSVRPVWAIDWEKVRWSRLQRAIVSVGASELDLYNRAWGRYA